MELGALVEVLRQRGQVADMLLDGDPTVDVVSVTHDSRAVGPGSMFCCVPGSQVDGHEFAQGAVGAGAVALLCERPVDDGVAELRVPSVRAAMGPVAAAVYGFPSERLDVVGITGTNGKTTATQLLAAMLEAAGRSCGIIGTLTGARTTPEAPELQARLASMLDDGRSSVAMEVSSHALDLHRIDGTRVRVAVFTNLSQDHLDHHGTMEAYYAAKARLFTPALSDRAVINIGDPAGRRLAQEATIPVEPFSLDDAVDLQVGVHGSSFRWRGVAMTLALPGRFNVANALAAATAAASLGVSPTDIARGLSTAGAVPGRFERVDAGQPFLAAVDYAHTPDGLARLLDAAREVAAGARVIVVFGAGGNRDAAKRPLMGEAAGQGADVVVLTTDNPRDEDPAAIISAVRAGISPSTDLRVEPDRAAAIALAVAEAAPGDVVLVAGKGHETEQVIGDRSLPFDDRVVLRDALGAAGYTGGAAS